MTNPVIYVDVDDTLKRTFGSKSFAIPHMVDLVKDLFARRIVLYCWSAGGALYAEECAKDLGIHHCFKGFLSKPTCLLDDIKFTDWFINEMHPNECRGLTVNEILKKVK